MKIYITRCIYICAIAKIRRGKLIDAGDELMDRAWVGRDAPRHSAFADDWGPSDQVVWSCAISKGRQYK